MASTFTTSNRFTLQGDGENESTWGSIVNNVFQLIEESIDGVASIDASGSGDLTLTSNDGSSDQSRHKVLKFTGTPTADRDVLVPNVQKVYLVDANHTAETLTLKIAGGSGVSFDPGDRKVVYADGTDVVLLADGNPTIIPSGLISMWSGSVASIPSGWALCDGTSGTPDLRDRFVVGAGSTYSVDDTGGSTSSTTNSAGSHDHGGNTGGHALSESEMPSHNHYNGISDNKQIGMFVYGSTTDEAPGQATKNPNKQSDNRPYQGFTSTEGGDQAHNHSISSDGSHTHDVDILPPYYALAYIMKL